MLRPENPEGFRVVGDCYVHGLSDSTAILGPLMEPWHVRNEYDSAGFWIPLYYNSNSGTTTLEDPRLPPLAPEWERIRSERVRGDPEVFGRFKNTITEKVVNSDPRLLPDALKERGLDIQVFNLR